MLADTDRPNSTDLANPAADNEEQPEGDGDVRGRDLEFDQAGFSDVDESEESSSVLSEHLLTWFDWHLSRGENRPTPVFYGSVPLCVGSSLFFPFGTWFAMSLVDAVNEGDALMAAMLMATMAWSHRCSIWTRVTCSTPMPMARSSCSAWGSNGSRWLKTRYSARSTSRATLHTLGLPTWCS